MYPEDDEDEMLTEEEREEAGEPCEVCINGATGAHKKLWKEDREDDSSEEPGAEWDNRKLDEVTVPEALDYYFKRLDTATNSLKGAAAGSKDQHVGTLQQLLAELKKFIQSNVVPHVCDVD